MLFTKINIIRKKIFYDDFFYINMKRVIFIYYIYTIIYREIFLIVL